MNTVQQICTDIVTGHFSNDELNTIIEAVKFARNRLANQVKVTVRVGSKVEFTSQKTGQTYQGTVEKMAIKYATVSTPAGRWKVPANMLTSI